MVVERPEAGNTFDAVRLNPDTTYV